MADADALQGSNIYSSSRVVPVLDDLGRLGDRCAKADELLVVFRALVSFAATQTSCNSLCVSFQERGGFKHKAVYVWLDGVEMDCRTSAPERTINPLASSDVTSENVACQMGFGILKSARGEERDGVCSRLTAPMVVRGNVVGTVELQSREPDHFTAEHASYMRVAANLVVTAAENLRLCVREAEQELQLRQSQKMETVGHLAGGVAHDFNNLTTAITGYADLALQRLGPGSESGAIRQDMEEIKRAGERAASLTRQLLALGRQEMVQAKVFDLNELVTDMGKMCVRIIGENIQLETRLPSYPCFVRAPHGQIEQVLLNLIVNSRDAMPQGGWLVVATEEKDFNESATANVPGIHPGRYVELTVMDTGIGMDAETARRIFEPFFTTKEPDKGTGLGLSTVHGIVKQSGGAISVLTAPGKGSTFRVYLPKASATEGPADLGQEGKSFVERKRGHETVLIVEDEDSVRNLAQQLLEQSGYTVLVAGSGEEALKVAASYTGDIDLMIADVVLPRITGHELARLLEQTRPDTSVLYISGYNNESLRQFGFAVEGVSFLQKPFTSEMLAITVRDLLDHRLPTF